MGSWISSTQHPSFFIVIAFLLVVVTSVSIIGIGLNSPQIALAQQQQPQANLTSVEEPGSKCI